MLHRCMYACWRLDGPSNAWFSLLKSARILRNGQEWWYVSHHTFVKIIVQIHTKYREFEDVHDVLVS
jgi:hypothetical protein